MKSRLIILAAVLALPGSAAFAAEPFADLRNNLQNHLRIELETCPEGMLGPNQADFILWCGSYDGSPKEFRSLWARAMSRIRAFQLEPESGWEKLGNGLSRFTFWRFDMPGMVLHYSEQGVVVIGLDQGPAFCSEVGLEGRKESGKYSTTETPGVVTPVRLDKEFPDYPLEARQKRLDGKVVLEGIVTTDGTVRQLCVTEATPNLRGFRKSAVESVRRWRYKPGTLNGEPVPFHWRVVVSFTIQ